MAKRQVLPGFKVSLAMTLIWIGLIVVIPLSTMFFKAATMDWYELWGLVSGPRALASYKLSFGASLIATSLNLPVGLLIAWVLVRYEFPGRSLLDAVVDVPIALPTAVSGIALTGLYAGNGWIGERLASVGINGAFSPFGVVVALVFVTLPLVVRAIQPVLESLHADVEAAAETLGANRWQIFTRVIFPAILPAIITGGALAFARALGEYGSVVFISGNMPFKTEITPLLIVTRLEEYDYLGAMALALVMLTVSLILLIAVTRLQRKVEGATAV